MNNTAGPGCSERDNARTNTRMIGDADRSEGAEGKIDITKSDKTNKTPILVCYKLNIRLFIKTYNVKRRTSRSIAPKQARKRDESQGKRQGKRRGAQDIQQRSKRHLY